LRIFVSSKVRILVEIFNGKKRRMFVEEEGLKKILRYVTFDEVPPERLL